MNVSFFAISCFFLGEETLEILGHKTQNTYKFELRCLLALFPKLVYGRILPLIRKGGRINSRTRANGVLMRNQQKMQIDWPRYLRLQKEQGFSGIEARPNHSERNEPQSKRF